MEGLPEDHFVKSDQFTKRTYRDQYPAIDPTSAALSQKGRVIVITGASKGIGKDGFATSFAKAGPRAIVISARSEGQLAAATKELQQINPDVEILGVAVDVSNPESVNSLWQKVKEKYGSADVLVNNAGSFTESGTVVDADVNQWWKDFEVNVRGTFLITQGFLKLLGKEKKGRIVSLTSSAAVSSFPGTSSYSLSKLAVLQLQSYIAMENPNVVTVSVHPGVVMTDMTSDMFKPFAKDKPALVGGLAVWLTTSQADFLNGKYVNANWSVEDLVERKDEILAGKLSMKLTGDFGSQQFE